MSPNQHQNLDFKIKIAPFGPASFRVEVTSSEGKATGTFKLPFDRAMLRNTLDGFRSNIKNSRDARSEDEVARKISVGEGRAILSPRQLGEGLFREVFQGDIETLYRKVRKQSWRERIPLPFKFEIAPEAEALINLPWEYLFDPRWGKRGDFLAFNEDTPVIRLWPGQEPRPPDTDPPLRVLLVSAVPRKHEEGLGNLEREIKAIETHLQQLNRPDEVKVRIDHLKAASLDELAEIVRNPERTPHILHFIGHGDTGSLLFEEQHTGQVKSASEETLTIMLRNASSLRLVVLNACRTARANNLQDQLGVAQSLADVGVPAVVAMQ
ncbi:MAG: CHAT domain-containing protein, partial [Caldilineae bacterium]